MRMQRYTLKHFSKFCWNRGPARAWLSTLERTCRQRGSARARLPTLEWIVKHDKSAGCMKFTLDGRSIPARAWNTSPRSSVHFPARADCKHMQSTRYTHFLLERYFPRSSVSSKSGISRFEPQAQILTLKHQFHALMSQFSKDKMKSWT